MRYDFNHGWVRLLPLTLSKSGAGAIQVPLFVVIPRWKSKKVRLAHRMKRLPKDSNAPRETLTIEAERPVPGRSRHIGDAQLALNSTAIGRYQEIPEFRQNHS
jgi:hypothetical protein